jgi:hypothetical protein|tara:strand:+ start:447 stop:596 length:150 start_codon:yes stop_codon:yes gene_type:complete
MITIAVKNVLFQDMSLSFFLIFDCAFVQRAMGAFDELIGWKYRIIAEAM